MKKSTDSAPVELAVDGNLNVIQGGSNFGRLEDFIEARPEHTGAAMLAIRAFHTGVLKAAADAKAEAAEETAKAREFALGEKNSAKEAIREANTAHENALSIHNAALNDALDAQKKANGKLDRVLVALRELDPQILPAPVRKEIQTAEAEEREKLLRAKQEIESRLEKLSEM